MDLDLLLNQKNKYKPMKPINRSAAAFIKTGERIAAEVKMSLDFDLRKLVSCNGGTIHDITFALFQQFSEKGILDNSIYVHKTEDFDIILHAYLPFDQTRYVLAHELGHYVLHAEEMSYAYQKGDAQIEQEAYYFALGFLMPETLFVEKYKLNQNDEWLASLFRLPLELIRSRKQSLNLQ
ncbi:MAG: ImmA/IrrE family metallo-endopeptidase [Planctomycetaceae bacterium]|jgi:Zn-dependent peptidase ImmA (M78 family)|nr:ImmA/IrrE family metallo-endopeptidase [Planctomycetaceae bacterium]